MAKNSILLTEEDTSARLKLSRNTLRNWRSQKKYIPFVHLGRSVRYREKDVENFILAHIVNPEV